MRDPKSILITGASSGIGSALALMYAAPGVTLALGGRDRARVEAVAADCRAAGADAHPRIVDVTDRDSMAIWIEEADECAPLELVIANAGISVGLSATDNAADSAADNAKMDIDARTREVMAVNIDGVINTVQPAVGPMRHRGRGQIALMASIAGFIAVPGSSAYCASKAAVRIWGEGLRGDLHGDGIDVSVICPGWVHTPMTRENRFAMPLAMMAPRAARIIGRGLARNRARIVFPVSIYLLARMIAALPQILRDPLMRRFPEKN